MPDIPTYELELYRLNEAGIPIDTVCTRPFVAAYYSRYKYGATAASNAFALSLGEAFQRAFPHLVYVPRLLIASSPYKYVPTAAHALACTFLGIVSQRRCHQGLSPARLIKIERLHPSSGDYGQLSVEQRHALMRANPLTLDRRLLQNAHLVVIDDVKVTGEHQACLIQATNELLLASRTFLHIASILIQSSAAFDPTIEDRLNHAYVKTLTDVLEIVQSPDFVWNVRLCKFLLNARNRARLPAFLARMPDCFLLALYKNSLGDGYHLMDAYRESHHLVHMTLQQRHLLVDAMSGQFISS